MSKKSRKKAHQFQSGGRASLGLQTTPGHPIEPPPSVVAVPGVQAKTETPYDVSVEEAVWQPEQMADSLPASVALVSEPAVEQMVQPAGEDLSAKIAELQRERDETQLHVASLSAEVALNDEKLKELERLRLENAGLRAKLLDVEAAKSEIAGLQAEGARLAEQLQQERSRRDELARKAEELGRREQQAIELEARIEEISTTWKPERVIELEKQCEALSRQVEYLKGYTTSCEHRIEELQAELSKNSPAVVDTLREQNASLLAENFALSEKIKRYELHVAELSTNIERLRRAGDLEKQNYQLIADRAALRTEMDKLKSQLSQYEAYRSLVQKIQLENQELKQAIDAVNESEQRRQQQGERAFDALRGLVEDPRYNRSLSGKIKPWPGDSEVVKLVDTMAKAKGFVFSLSQIRWLLASIRSSRFIILKGFSGLGKTSLPIIVARAIGAPCEVIPVQPSWKSKVDLLGFFNHFDQRFLPTLFTKALLKAQLPAFQDRHFFIVLDEMNLSRVEYYFSDFNVKLEDPNDPTIELFDNASIGVKLSVSGIGKYIRDGNRLPIPRNVTFVGTVNDDETTYSISDKIYDRAQVMDFQDISQSGHGTLPSEDEVFDPLSFVGYLDSQPKDGHNEEIDRFLNDLNKELRNRFYANLSYRPRGQIQAFIRAYLIADGNPSEALDLQMVSKVIPKIRYSHRSGFDEDIRELGEYIQKSWPFAGKVPEKTRRALELLKAQA